MLKVDQPVILLKVSFHQKMEKINYAAKIAAYPRKKQGYGNIPHDIRKDQENAEVSCIKTR